MVALATGIRCGISRGMPREPASSLSIQLAVDKGIPKSMDGQHEREGGTRQQLFR